MHKPDSKVSKPKKEKPKKEKGLCQGEPMSSSLAQPKSFNAVLNICAESIDITDEGESLIKGLSGKRFSLKVRWNFMNFPPTCTSLVGVSSSIIRLKYTRTYDVMINEAFLRYLTSKPIMFEVYIFSKRQEMLMGKGDVIFKDILDKANMYVYKTVEISNLEKVLLVKHSDMFKIYANLNISYILKCSGSDLCNLSKAKGSLLQCETCMRTLINKISKVKASTDEEYRSDTTDLVSQKHNSSKRAKRVKNLDRANAHFTMNENKIRGKQKKHRKPTDHKVIRRRDKGGRGEDISTEDDINSRVEKQIQEKLKSKEVEGKVLPTIKPRKVWESREVNVDTNDFEIIRTLEEYAILNGRDPGIVNCPSWKKRELPNVILRSYSTKEYYYPYTIIIYIHSLRFYPNSSPMRNKNITRIYLEYAFLTQEENGMESITLLKPYEGESLRFNFKRTFHIDMDKCPKDCGLLARMIKNKKNIMIEVISEPNENSDRILSCEVIGLCEIDLKNLVQLEDNILKAKFVVYNAKNRKEDVGYLKISISGIQAMRDVALRILAPPDYFKSGPKCLSMVDDSKCM